MRRGKGGIVAEARTDSHADAGDRLDQDVALLGAHQDTGRGAIVTASVAEVFVERLGRPRFAGDGKREDECQDATGTGEELLQEITVVKGGGTSALVRLFFPHHLRNTLYNLAHSGAAATALRVSFQTNDCATRAGACRARPARIRDVESCQRSGRTLRPVDHGIARSRGSGCRLRRRGPVYRCSALIRPGGRFRSVVATQTRDRARRSRGGLEVGIYLHSRLVDERHAARDQGSLSHSLSAPA